MQFRDVEFVFIHALWAWHLQHFKLLGPSLSFWRLLRAESYLLIFITLKFHFKMQNTFAQSEIRQMYVTLFSFACLLFFCILMKWINIKYDESQVLGRVRYQSVPPLCPSTPCLPSICYGFNLSTKSMTTFLAGTLGILARGQNFVCYPHMIWHTYTDCVCVYLYIYTELYFEVFCCCCCWGSYYLCELF